MKNSILIFASILSAFMFASFLSAAETKIIVTPIRADAAFKAGSNHWGVYNGKPYYYYGDRYHEYYRRGRRYYYYDYYNSYDYHRRKASAAYNEIERLEDMKKAAENARQELKGIKITRARFYKQYATDSAAESMAEIAVQNNSNHTIAEFYFKGTVKTAKGKVLIDDYFEFSPQQALSSGEKATYKIALNSYGAWADFKTPPDNASFAVSLDGIETEDGQSFSFEIFSADEQKRLNQLKNAYVY
ncbi:MAG: hypothetical protein LBO62_01715 [Endomicrobium sp.]|jgi:hypothetical protein|nr:hypothetical protein [Endomicrobium sp.]